MVISATASDGGLTDGDAVDPTFASESAVNESASPETAGNDAWNPAARLGGTITDLGPAPYASGEVGLNNEGEISTYTVASGDTAWGISDRLCIDYVTVMSYNGKSMPPVEIQPGDILILRP
ncbi:LysM domain-containing protein [Microbacterium sp. 2P01SA-2]|uniref:LysM peptidoglycan-binding domain-containing protein n=1 Tax=unclassified Microbacterium TaxID=2609290 RepID=UPI0039A13CBD